MILITGATGTVGSELLKKLSAMGADVRALTRDVRRAEASPVPRVQYVQGDFDDLDSLRRACAGVERAFLLTNSSEESERRQIDFVNVARESGVQWLVKLSQFRANPTAPARFLRYHAAVEAAVRASKMTFTLLRPNLYMQGMLNFAPSIQRNGSFYAAAGAALISAVDVRDVAEIAAGALTTSRHVNRTYTLTGPEALTFTDMAAQLSTAIGRPVTYVDVPPKEMLDALAGIGFPDWQAEGLLEEFAMYRRGEASVVESGMWQALGRCPRSFEQFARDYAHFFTS